MKIEGAYAPSPPYINKRNPFHQIGGEDRTEKPTPTHCVRKQSSQNHREFPCPTFPPLFQQKTPFLLPYST